MSNNVLIKNKKGYKKTKLGWIPEDWEVKKLKSLVKINRNTLTENTKPEYQFYYLDISAVKQGKILIPHNTIIFSEAPCRARRIVKQNNILFSTVRPYLQSFAVMKNSKENFVASTGFAILSDFKNINNMYLYQSLYSNLLMNQYKKSLVGTNYPALNNTDMLNLKFICPNDIREQEKIAEILSAWDEGIDVIEKLIEQKEILKNSLSKKFFQRKNNVFELRQYKLGELFNNRKETNCCELELLSICEGLGIVPRSKLNAKDNSNKDKSKYLKVCVGDLAYNTMRMWQGRCGVSSYEGIVSPAYTVCIPKGNIDVDYMYYLFKTPHMIHDFWRYSQGIVEDTLNLKFNNFEIIKVLIPDKKTQTEIAKLLKSYDKEIQLLNFKLEKLKEQKKGLMQKLLTGQIRVKV